MVKTSHTPGTLAEIGHHLTRNKIITIKGVSMKKFIYIFITIVNIIIFTISIVFYTKISELFFKDTNFNNLIPLLIALLTLSGAIPTYLFSKKLDRNRLKNDLEKDREIKKQKEKEEKYKILIPYIFLKRSPRNFMYFENDIKMKILASKYSVSFEDSNTNPTFDKKIFDYSQIKISEIIWFLYTFASSEVIEAVHKFNNAIPSIENYNNKIEFEELINAIRKDLGNEEIKFDYGNK